MTNGVRGSGEGGLDKRIASPGLLFPATHALCHTYSPPSVQLLGGGLATDICRRRTGKHNICIYNSIIARTDTQTSEHTHSNTQDTRIHTYTGLELKQEPWQTACFNSRFFPLLSPCEDSSTGRPFAQSPGASQGPLGGLINILPPNTSRICHSRIWQHSTYGNHAVCYDDYENTDKLGRRAMKVKLVTSFIILVDENMYTCDINKTNKRLMGCVSFIHGLWHS